MANNAVTFTLRGKRYSLTRSKVEEALVHVTPGQVDKYFVTIAGKDYPPKQVLSLALGVAPSEFISTDATRILKKVGYEVHRSEDIPLVVKTGSEQLLESYLLARGMTDFEFEPQVRGSAHRPDFVLDVGGHRLVLEVKQFEPTPADFSLGARGYDPYGPIREKIEAGRKKFKDLREYCCCLILYNRGNSLVDLGWRHIYAAMLGNLAIRMPFDPARGLLPDHAESGPLGGGGKMIRYTTGDHLKPLEPQNTTISAVLVLQHLGKRRFCIDVSRREQEMGRELSIQQLYEAPEEAQGTERDWWLTRVRLVTCMNSYARIPLPREIFRGHYDEQYGLDETTQDRIT